MAAQTSTAKLVSQEVAGLLARNVELFKWVDTEPYGAYLPEIIQALLDFGFSAKNIRVVKGQGNYDLPTIQVRINAEDDVMEQIELLRKFHSEWWFKQSFTDDQEIGVYLE